MKGLNEGFWLEQLGGRVEKGRGAKNLSCLLWRSVGAHQASLGRVGRKPISGPGLPYPEHQQGPRFGLHACSGQNVTFPLPACLWPWDGPSCFGSLCPIPPSQTSHHVVLAKHLSLPLPASSHTCPCHQPVVIREH